MSDDLPDFLVSYLAKRDAQRADAVNTLLGSLTDRERALVKDAAVMGYVRGMTHPQSEKCPKDSAILAEVIDACLALPDLYPALTSAPETVAHPPKTDWIVEYKTDDDWAHLGLYNRENADFMVTDLAAREMATRLIRATTTYTVEPTPAVTEEPT